MAIFRGWVPTITGHLSFSTIGLGRRPKKLFKQFRALDDTRYTVVCQQRLTTDVLFGKVGNFFINSLLRRQGYTVFIFFGQSLKKDGFHVISGPCVELPRSVYMKHEKKLQALCGQSNSLEYERAFEGIAKFFVSLASAKDGSAVTAVQLRRDGLLEVSVDDERLETTGEKQLIASQVYFFMRDITHAHQHHAETSDTILDVTSTLQSWNAWKRETSYSLYRWVIQQKRARTSEAYLSAKGVLAYARAFEKIHISENDKDVPRYLHDSTQESIQAGLESATFRAEKEGVFTSNFINKVIPLLTFAFSLLLPLYGGDNPAQPSEQQKLISAFDHWFNRNIILVIFGTIALGIVYNVGFTFRKALFTGSFTLDLLRLFVRLRFSLVVVCSFLLLFVSIVLSWSFFANALTQLAPYDFGP